MKKVFSAREVAMISLGKTEKSGAYSNIELNAAMEKYALKGKDRELFAALYYGSLERIYTLDHFISKLSTISNDKISPNIRNILRISIYQLLFLDKIPEHAIVDEAVKLANYYSNKGAAGFVNAILRNAIRRKISLGDISDKGVLYSYPEWMVKLWNDAYGSDKADEIMKAQNTHSYTALHINTLKIARDEFASGLIEDGLSVKMPDEPCEALLIEKCPPVKDIRGFDEGLFYVQDLSSQLACELLGVKPGAEVIDCCACPGGKSFACAIAMKNEGNIHSFDLHKNKLSLIEKGAERLGIEIIKPAEVDATKPNNELFGKADFVLCDVPCSGLGVISKKPDIRLKSENDIKGLPEIQKSILEKSISYLKSGGRLMYSTCTLNPAENEKITNAFLETHPEFSRISDRFPMTVFPTESRDGFFIDIFEKAKG